MGCTHRLALQTRTLAQSASHSGLAAVWETECIGVNLSPKELAAWWEGIKAALKQPVMMGPGFCVGMHREEDGELEEEGEGTSM